MDGAIIMPRDHAHAYALTFPGAYAEHPWGQTVIKVKRKVFLFVIHHKIGSVRGISFMQLCAASACFHQRHALSLS